MLLLVDSLLSTKDFKEVCIDSAGEVKFLLLDSPLKEYRLQKSDYIGQSCLALRSCDTRK